MLIPERERYHAPLSPPERVERSVDPAGVDMTVNPVNPVGISSVTGIPESGTFPVFVSVIVYSNTSPMILSHPLISTTPIVAARRGILRINDVVLLASM